MDTSARGAGGNGADVERRRPVKLLAVETASDACSAALAVDGALVERYLVAPRRHAELLLGMVAEVLAEAELSLAALDALGFGRGPGSFTGVRVGTGVIQGLALGADLPVVGVSSLRALAQGALRELGGERFLCAFDARMDEVYWGAFAAGRDGLVTAVGAEVVCSPEGLPPVEDGWWLGVGDGWAAHGERLARQVGARLRAVRPDRLPRARDVAVLALPIHARGESVAAADAQPVYLRDRVTRVSARGA